MYGALSNKELWKYQLSPSEFVSRRDSVDVQEEQKSDVSKQKTEWVMIGNTTKHTPTQLWWGVLRKRFCREVMREDS